MPSTASPLRPWKTRTAASVRGPNTPSGTWPRALCTRTTSGPELPRRSISAGAPGAIARFAGDAAATRDPPLPPAPAAAKAAAVGDTTIAALTTPAACLRRAISRRPCAASTRRRRERASDRSHTSNEARSLWGACILRLSFFREPTELADGLARKESRYATPWRRFAPAAEAIPKKRLDHPGSPVPGNLSWRDSALCDPAKIALCGVGRDPQPLAMGQLIDHIRSYYEALNTGDPDRVAAHFTDDATHYYTRLGPHEGSRT